MAMSRVSLVLVATAAVALGGCFSRGPQSVQYQQVQPPAAASSPGLAPRGFFAVNPGGPFARAPAQAYRAPAPVPAFTVSIPVPAPAPAMVYTAPAPAVYAAPPSAPCTTCGAGPHTVTAAYGYAAQPMFDTPYLLDAGDRLRVTVFGQEGLTNSYAVDASGNVTIPLVGTMPARGMTTEQLSYALTERLKQGYIREPKVAIEVEAYRPFFIHGEVGTPGQYAYVANMTVENAIAIAGGFGPRADRGKVTVSRTAGGQTSRATVGLSYPLRPGDTLRIGERWF